MRQLLQELQALSWWGRLFGWSRIRRMLLDASTEWESNQTSMARMSAELQALQNDLMQAQQAVKMAEARAGDLHRDKERLDLELGSSRREVQRLGSELAGLTQVDQQRRTELQNNLTSLAQLKERIAEERLQEHQARQEELERKQQRLRQTWQTHQVNVSNKIRQIAEKYTLQVVDKFPMKGEPDNVLMLCEQYVVLDAKSPGGRTWPILESTSKHKLNPPPSTPNRRAFLVSFSLWYPPIPSNPCPKRFLDLSSTRCMLSLLKPWNRSSSALSRSKNT